MKLHPRSNCIKYTPINELTEIVEYIPRACNVLIGYKSNLLFADIKHDTFYRFNMKGFEPVELQLAHADDSLKCYQKLEMKEILR